MPEFDGFVYRKSKRRRTVTGVVPPSLLVELSEKKKDDRKVRERGTEENGNRWSRSNEEESLLTTNGGDVLPKRAKVRKSLGRVRRLDAKSGSKRKSVGRIRRKRKLYMDLPVGISEEEKLKLLMERILSVVYAKEAQNGGVSKEAEQAIETVMGYVEDVVAEELSTGGVAALRRSDPKTIFLRRKMKLLTVIKEQYEEEARKWEAAEAQIEEDGALARVCARKSPTKEGGFSFGMQMDKREQAELEEAIKTSVLKTRKLIESTRQLEADQERAGRFCDAIARAVNEKALGRSRSVEDAKTAIQASMCHAQEKNPGALTAHVDYHLN